MTLIDTSTPMPLYFQVYSSLLERIRDGEFDTNQPLPSERKLTEEYGVSRITIVKAMDLLKNEGFIDRQHGRGTFVRDGKISNDPSKQLSLTDHLLAQGLNPEWQLLKKEWIDPAAVGFAGFPEASADDPYFQATVGLLTEGQPIAYLQMQVLADVARRSRIELMTDKELLDFYRDYPSKTNCGVERGFEAISADPDVAKYLDIEPHAPVLAIDLLYRNGKGDVLELIKSCFRGDSFRYNL